MKESLYIKDKNVLLRETFNNYNGRYSESGLSLQKLITQEFTIRAIFYATGTLDLISFDDTENSGLSFGVKILSNGHLTINGNDYYPGFGILSLNKKHEILISSGLETYIFIDGGNQLIHFNTISSHVNNVAIGQSVYGTPGTINGYIELVEIYNNIKSKYLADFIFSKKLSISNYDYEAISITVNTSLGTNNGKFTIPLKSGLIYTCAVDWGDDIITELSSANDTRNVHQYKDGKDEHTIKIYGRFGGFYFNNGGDKLKLTKINSWGSKNSLSIIDYSFRGCSNLESDLLFPETITSIGQYAFDYCSSVNSISLHDFIDEIKTYAFGHMSNVNGDLIIPENITSLNQYMFNGTSIGGELVIPGTITRIPDYSFYGVGFSLLTIQQGVEAIGTNAFRLSTGTGNLILPDSMTSIENNAFLDGNFLNSTLTLPSNLSSIGGSAFMNCKFIGDLYIPGTLNNINSYSFQSNKFNGTLTIGEGTTVINVNAFIYTRFTSINLPNSLITIGAYAFRCYNNQYYLTSLTIPENVTSIQDRAFNPNGNISVVYCYPATAPTLGLTPLLFTGTARPLHVPVGATGYNVSPWTDTSIFSEIIYDL